MLNTVKGKWAKGQAGSGKWEVTTQQRRIAAGFRFPSSVQLGTEFGDGFGGDVLVEGFGGDAVVFVGKLA